MKNLFLNAALIRTTRWCGAVTAMQTHLVRMALAVFCLALTGASALGQTATDGDYRTLATGNWSSSSTWQVRSGGTWATASSAPTSANSIYIQTGHTVTVDSATVACKDLQMGGGVLAIGTNTVQVNGKLRGYTLASAVTSTADGGLYTAANLTNPTGITSTAATGYLSIVGNTRTLTFTGEWGANLSTVDTSIDLNAGQTVTMQTSHKSRNWKFNTGTYDAGTFRIAADDGSGTGGVGHGDVTIASGATVISAATGTGTSAVFGQTGSRSAGTLTLNSGATLKLNGAAPGIAMGAVTFNGTVEYGAAGAQTLAVVLNSGAGPTNYTNLKLSGSGTKTLGANTTVTDTLTMAGGTLALSTFALNYGGSSTLEYAGSAQQTTATTEFPASAGPNSLKINNASGVKLGAARTVASTLTLAAGAFDLNGNTFAANTLASSGSITNSGAATTLTVGGSGGSSSFGGVISGALALTKSGAGTLTLTAANTYSGNTTVSAGTLALSGSGSVASTPNITVAAGATFDVSAVSSALTLGSSQTLTASGSGSVGTLATTTGAGLTLGSTGPLQFTAYDGVNAPLTVSGAGSLTLAAGNAVTVTVNGTALVAGDYKLVSKGSGNTTAVNGTAPTSVTVNGTGGLGSGLSGSLVITAGELFLHVASGTAAPTVTSSAATSISTTAATLNGNVTSDGGATVSERGFVYKTSTGVTITDNKNTVAGTTGAYSLGVSSLAVNTQYFFKAYAINAAGTTLSSELNFWTLANAPSAPTVSGATATTLQVAVNANGNPAGTLFAIHETTQNKYVQADGTLNTSAVYQTAATWGTKTVTGLTTLTTYTFEVKAQNGGGTDTAFSATANGTTTGSSNADLSALVVNTGPLWLSPTFASGTTNYTVYPDHSTNSITITPTLADTNATIKVNGTTVVSGATSGAISLVDGTNIITVLVTAQDAVTTKTNTIYAIRSAAPLPTGAIAFVGFNADGNDDVAFVALTNLPANTVIHFTDNGWNGSAIGSGGTFNFTESEWVWIAPNAGLAAGTIVAFTNINAGILTPTVGTAEFADAANRGLSTSAETVYAFQGASHAPTVFLAGLTTESATNFNNTGLTTNVTAVVLSSSSDGGSYKGARTGQATFDGYLALIGDVANNWNDVGNGDGTTLLPFSSTAFTASAYDANVSINDVSITEGDAGTKTLTFTVTRSTSAGAFTVDYTTTNGTATTANSDYVATNGTLTFTAGGSLTQIIGVTINGDTTPEADETFFVNLTNVVNSLGTVTLTMSQGTGTILNDDPIAPSFTSLPSNQTIPTGSATTLSVTASGTPAPTYQWYVGTSGTTTSPIANATNASYTTSVLLATTSYWVRVTNSAGTADSSTAVLTTSYQTPYASTNLEVYAPNTAAWNPAGVTNNGTVFINLGLQGMGRVPASTIDPVTGESLGSVSDLQITGWKKNTNGSYSGTLNTLPDRGYNNGATFSNYGARINKFDFTFTPYTNSTPTSAQNQIALTFAGSTRFTYDNGSGQKFTTGLPADGTLSLFGTTVPVASGNSIQSDGTVTNRLTLDSEGLALDRRAGKSGAGWIGDEYGASIYHFNSSKQIDGQLILPAALIPHNPVGTVNFNGTPVNGRRDNQGVEGLAQSPDGTRLFALMQSATIQDTGSGNQGRYNTRLLVYDISSTDTPNDPIAQYVIQLPRIDTTGSTTNGTTVDKVGAQSSIVALSTNQILILSRDGNGRGSSGSPVFKSILLADLSSASNIDGTYDAEGDQVAPGGTLRGSIVPLAWTEALNMVGKLGATTAEVEKFGLNLNPAPGDTNTISEKWEALSMVSANDPTNPNDYFLFVGNDNDFLSRTGKYLDASGTIQTYDAGLENDTLFLVWRVRMTSSFNQAPFVANAIADQTAVATVPFTLTFPTNTFVDPEGQTLTYTATMSDDTALPSWLTFNAGTRTFSGTPASGDAGTLTVKVTATDNGSPNLFGSLTFNITTSVDSTPPTISIGSPSVSLTNTGAVTYTVT
ncbi:MAG: hypothetical protein EBS05_04645, partial [Proteobacteria bacterium]|nr:hypothetical protein [Pseudomonadota bacterium]